VNKQNRRDAGQTMHTGKLLYPGNPLTAVAGSSADGRCEYFLSTPATGLYNGIKATTICCCVAVQTVEN
jgi:hypothetical protein